MIRAHIYLRICFIGPLIFVFVLLQVRVSAVPPPGNKPANKSKLLADLSKTNDPAEKVGIYLSLADFLKTRTVPDNRLLPFILSAMKGHPAGAA